MSGSRPKLDGGVPRDLACPPVGASGLFLPGTGPIAEDGTVVFRDRYRTQYQQTIDFLDAMLDQCREDRRSAWDRDGGWIATKRDLLARRTGFQQFAPAATSV